MIKLRSLLAVSIGMLAAFTLNACLTGDDKGSEGGANFSFTSDIKVLNNTAPQGSAPGTITTQTVDTYCEEGEFFSDTTTDTSKYVISGGNLFIWSPGECRAMKLSGGSSSTIIGTWTSTSLDAMDSVPLAYRPLICDDDESEDGDLNLLENTSVEYKISNTRIKAKASGKVCFAKYLAIAFGGFNGDSSAFDVLVEDCTTLKVRNDSNKVATFTTGYKNDSATIKFTYGNKTCAGAAYLPLSEITPTSCSEEGDDDNEGGSSFSNYFQCVLESGFYGDLDLDKRQSLEKGMSKALRPDLGF